MASTNRRRTHAENVKYYNMAVREQRADESDIQYFKSLAKQADQRLVRLERYAKDKNYQGLLQYAYASAVYDIRTLIGGSSDKMRFNRALPKNKDGSYDKRALHARLNAVKRFLESPTSTKAATTKVYQERAKTTNELYGTNFTWEELAAFYSRSSHEADEKKVGGSKTMVRVLGAMKRIGDDPERIEAAKRGDIKISGDAVVAEITKNLLEQGLSYSDFIN